MLWHATFAGGWNGIRRAGLRPTSELLAAVGREREAEDVRRSIVRVHTADGTAVLRDQVPNRKDPAPYLIDVTVEEWWQLINGRVYLFGDRAPLERLLGAYLSQGYTQEVIEFDARLPLEPVAGAVEVTTVNAGVFPRSSEPSRGRSTFVPLAEFDGQASKIKEITVTAAVPVQEVAVRSVTRHTAGHDPARLSPRV